MLVGGCACLGVTTIILFAAPQSAVVGVVALIVALLLLLPLLLDAIVAGFERLQRVLGSEPPARGHRTTLPEDANTLDRDRRHGGVSRCSGA